MISRMFYLSFTTFLKFAHVSDLISPKIDTTKTKTKNTHARTQTHAQVLNKFCYRSLKNVFTVSRVSAPFSVLNEHPIPTFKGACALKRKLQFSQNIC